MLNIRNLDPTLEDWNHLMSVTDSFLTPEEHQTFQTLLRVYATNNMVTLHNKKC